MRRRCWKRSSGEPMKDGGTAQAIVPNGQRLPEPADFFRASVKSGASVSLIDWNPCDLITLPLFTTTAVRCASALIPQSFGPAVLSETASAVFLKYCAIFARYCFDSSTSAGSQTATTLALDRKSTSSFFRNRNIGRSKDFAATNT